mmetsp:Transcript_10409/g.38632  ORF Transcript_10409/g.38632 Transcript_10409/m.38632 type:complete len:1579 (-) Transcript_10409:271-5007(-)
MGSDAPAVWRGHSFCAEMIQPVIFSRCEHFRKSPEHHNMTPLSKNSGFSKRCKQRFRGFSQATLLLTETVHIATPPSSLEEFHRMPVQEQLRQQDIEWLPIRHQHSPDESNSCTQNVEILSTLVTPCLPQDHVPFSLHIQSSPPATLDPSDDLHIFQEVEPAHWSTYWPSLKRAHERDEKVLKELSEFDYTPEWISSTREETVHMLPQSHPPSAMQPEMEHFSRFSTTNFPNHTSLAELIHSRDKEGKKQISDMVSFDICALRPQQIHSCSTIHSGVHLPQMCQIIESFEHMPVDFTVEIVQPQAILAHRPRRTLNPTDEIQVLPSPPTPTQQSRDNWMELTFDGIDVPFLEPDTLLTQWISSVSPSYLKPPHQLIWECVPDAPREQPLTMGPITIQLNEPMPQEEIDDVDSHLDIELTSKYDLPHTPLDTASTVSLVNRFLAAYQRLYEKSAHEPVVRSTSQNLSSTLPAIEDSPFDESLEAHIAMETGNMAFFASTKTSYAPSERGYQVEPETLPPVSRQPSPQSTSSLVEEQQQSPNILPSNENIVSLPHIPMSLEDQKLVQRLLSSMEYLLFAWSDRFHLFNIISVWTYNMLLNGQKSVCLSCSKDMIHVLQLWMEAFFEDEIPVSILRVDEEEHAGTVLSGFNKDIHRVCLLSHSVAAYAATSMRDFLGQHSAYFHIDSRQCDSAQWQMCLHVCAAFLDAGTHHCHVNIATCVPPANTAHLRALFDLLPIFSLTVVPCKFLTEGTSGLFPDVLSRTVNIHLFNHKDDLHIVNAVDTISDAAKDLISEINSLLPGNQFTSVSDFTCDMIKNAIKNFTDSPPPESEKREIMHLLRLFAAMYWIVATITKLLEEGMFPALKYLEQVEGRKISSRYPVLQDLHSFLKDYTKYRITDSNPKFFLLGKVLEPIFAQASEQILVIISRTEHEFPSITTSVHSIDANMSVYAMHEEDGNLIAKLKGRDVELSKVHLDHHVVCLFSLDSFGSVQGNQFVKSRCTQLLLANVDLITSIPTTLLKAFAQSKFNLHIMMHDNKAHKQMDEALCCWLHKALHHCSPKSREQLTLLPKVIQKYELNEQWIEDDLLKTIPESSDHDTSQEMLQTIIVTESFLSHSQLVDILSQRQVDMIERRHYSQKGQYDPSLIVSPKTCVLVREEWSAKKAKKVVEILSILSQQYEVCHIIVSPLNQDSVCSLVEMESYCLNFPTKILWHLSRSVHETADLIVDIVRNSKVEIPLNMQIFECESDFERYLCRSFHLSNSFNAYAAQFLMGMFSVGNYMAMRPDQLDLEVGEQVPRKSIHSFDAAMRQCEEYRFSVLEMNPQLHDEPLLSDSFASPALHEQEHQMNACNPSALSISHPPTFSNISSLNHYRRTTSVTPEDIGSNLNLYDTPPAPERRQLLWNMSPRFSGGVNVNSSSPRDGLRFLTESTGDAMRPTHLPVTQCNDEMQDDQVETCILSRGKKRKQNPSLLSTPPPSCKRRKRQTPNHLDKSPYERVETPLQTYRRRKGASQQVIRVGKFQLLDDEDEGEESDNMHKTTIPRGKGGRLQKGSARHSQGTIQDQLKEIKRLKRSRQNIK